MASVPLQVYSQDLITYTLCAIVKDSISRLGIYAKYLSKNSSPKGASIAKQNNKHKRCNIYVTNIYIYAHNIFTYKITLTYLSCKVAPYQL